MRGLPLWFLAALTLVGCGDPAASKPDDGASTDTNTDESTDPGSDTDTATDTTTEDQLECPADTPAALMDCVDEPRYEQDLQFVADIRVPGTAHWQAVQDLCADQLIELGFDVELHDYGTGTNVIGVRPGSDDTGERVVVGAHYDHIPDCTGANDNATGVTAALELARVLAEHPTPRTLVVACWDEEELGLLGSAAHAQAALDAGDQLTAVFSLDMIGFASDEPNSQFVPTGFDLLFPEQYAELEANDFRGDFLLWVSDDTMEAIGFEFDGFAELLALPTLGASLSDDLKSSPLLADLRRSDHASFWDLDIPAMLMNDSGEFRYSSYHCADGEDDTLDKIDTEFAVKVTKAAVATTAVALGF